MAFVWHKNHPSNHLKGKEAAIMMDGMSLNECARKPARPIVDESNVFKAAKQQFTTEIKSLLRQAADGARGKLSPETHALTEEGLWASQGEALPSVWYQLVESSPNWKSCLAPPSIGFRLNDRGQIEIRSGAIPCSVPVVIEIGRFRLKDAERVFDRFVKLALER